MRYQTSEQETEFLRDVPPEVQRILDWYRDGAVLERRTERMRKFAKMFLAALKADQAIIPALAGDPAKLFARVLLHHQNSSANPAAWLNLGFVFRRMAIYRHRDSREVNRRRLESALMSFVRSLELEPDNRGKNARAWTGQALTYHQLGRYEDEVRCASRAVQEDGADPHLWLFYAFALGAAGKREEALALTEDAHKAYLSVGKPEDLREYFAGLDRERRVGDHGATVRSWVN